MTATAVHHPSAHRARRPDPVVIRRRRLGVLAVVAVVTLAGLVLAGGPAAISARLFDLGAAVVAVVAALALAADRSRPVAIAASPSTPRRVRVAGATPAVAPALAEAA